MHRIRFRLGLRPRPRWGSLQRSPDPLAGFKGPNCKGRREGAEGTGGEDKGGQGKGRERRGEGGKGKGEGNDGIGEWEGGEREWGSPTHYFRLKSCTACGYNPPNVTDRQADTGRQQRPRLRIASRGKNCGLATEIPCTQ